MKLLIENLGQTYLRIKSEPAVLQELHDHFSFIVPNFRFMPAFKAGVWDGRMHLFNLKNKTIYAGLLPKILEYAEANEYEVEFLEETTFPFSSTEAQIKEWVAKLNLPGITPHDFQFAALETALEKKGRAIFLSATGSGKSLIIYLLFRFFHKRTLLIVPTTGLIRQMESDLRDYGYDGDIQLIYEGQSKKVTGPIVISTWQSIYKLPKVWFEQFGMVIGDEAHTFKASSLITIMEKLDQCPLRFGLSGTLDDATVHEMTLQGLFGDIITLSKSHELIERGILSNFLINNITLKYSNETKEAFFKSSYEEEIDFLIKNPNRNEFIRKLVTRLKGNTLLLFHYVEDHGEELYRIIKESTDRPVYFISGKIKAQERERIRQEIERQDNAILVASMNTTSTGINIKSLRNIVFASPSKAKIKILQAIGRVLRKSENKELAVLWDLSDDLSIRGWKNYTLKHFIERIKVYSREKFDYKLLSIKIEQGD